MAGPPGVYQVRSRGRNAFLAGAVYVSVGAGNPTEVANEGIVRSCVRSGVGLWLITFMGDYPAVGLAYAQTLGADAIVGKPGALTTVAGSDSTLQIRWYDLLAGGGGGDAPALADPGIGRACSLGFYLANS